jgi:hypothetical protein
VELSGNLAAATVLIFWEDINIKKFNKQVGELK